MITFHLGESQLSQGGGCGNAGTAAGPEGSRPHEGSNRQTSGKPPEPFVSYSISILGKTGIKGDVAHEDEHGQDRKKPTGNCAVRDLVKGIQGDRAPFQRPDPPKTNHGHADPDGQAYGQKSNKNDKPKNPDQGRIQVDHGEPVFFKSLNPWKKSRSKRREKIKQPRGISTLAGKSGNKISPKVVSPIFQA